MNFTPEQLEKLVKGFQEHDITQAVHLRGKFEKTKKKKNETEQPPQENPFKSRVLKYMESNLSEFGFNRYINNFSGQHPVKLLMDADSTYISDEAMNVLHGDQQLPEAVDQYLELFLPLAEHAAEVYCTAKGKNIEDLTDDEQWQIMNRVTTVVNEELMSGVMQGQQFSEIISLTHTAQTHEDFSDNKKWTSNMDAINFYNQWNHCNTAIGAMLTLDDEENPIDPPYFDDDPVFMMMCKAFCETLDDVDSTIFYMRLDGYNHSEIAKKLGYKTHSAVTKRLESMCKRWHTFMDEIKPQ